MALLGALPAALYLIYGIFIRGDLASQFSGRFIPALMFSPLNYLQWEVKASMAAGGIFVMLGLLSFFLIHDRRLRSFLYGLWGAYLVYRTFLLIIMSPRMITIICRCIPIVGLSLAPLGDWFFTRINGSSSPALGAERCIAVILIFGLFSVVWDVRNQMKAVDYRPEAAMWAEIGEQFDEKARIVALTQDYGSRLEYWGWRTAATWPYLGDANYANMRGGTFSFDELFNGYSSKMRLFPCDRFR